MRAGATDFLVKPVAPERLLEALAANSDRRRAAGRACALVRKTRARAEPRGIDRRRARFPHRAGDRRQGARSRLPILIVGEPGSGKETIARAIHAASLRAKAPMIRSIARRSPPTSSTANCSAMSPGAFPGAFAERVGRIVEADGGTLLLDEVGALPLETQEKLDRVLATGEVRPVGCNGSNSVDVRVIATTSRPLPADFNPAWPSGSPRPPSPSPPCASAAATSPPSPATSSRASPSSRACARCRSAMTRSRC